MICACWLIAGSAEAVDCNNTGEGTLTYLLSQTAVDEFQSDYGPCDRVGGSLEIRQGDGMEPITDLSPLADLVEVGEFLSVQGDFTDLNGLHNLTTIGISFTLTGADLLTDLTGLTSLESVGSLTLTGLNSLTSLAGMPNLSTVRDLELSNLPFLPNLTGLPAVVDVEDLAIRDTEVTSLDGAPVMNSLRYLQLESTSLSDLSGLSVSTFVSDPVSPGGTSIDITFNFQLTNLVGLPVDEKMGSIQVTNNPALTSLAGLEDLVEVWAFLRIQDNDFLADCSVLATVLDEVDDGDPGPGDGSNPDDPPDSPGLSSIQILDNGEDLPPDQSACNSIEEILASVDTQVIHEDGFEGEAL